LNITEIDSTLNNA